MSNLPNIKTLFIPHKTMRTVGQPGYGDDMRAIEIWARSQKATGATVGAIGFSATAGQSGSVLVPWGSGAVGSGTATAQARGPIAGSSAGIGWPPGDNVSGTIYEAVVMEGGFLFVPASAGAKNLLTSMTFSAPNFTGPSSTVGMILVLTAASANGAAPAAASFRVSSRQINLASAASHVLGSTDFLSATITGTDLTWTGTTNMALASGNSLQVPTIVGWSVIGIWDAANTYT